MILPDRPIAAIQGASSVVIQELLRAFVASVRPLARVVGVLEESPLAFDPSGGDAQLRSLTDARRYPIFQDLGPDSTACGLDAGSVVTACEAVRRDIAAGC